MFGEEHRAESVDAIEIMSQLGGNQPELAPVEFLCRTWESMTYRYIAKIRDAARRMMRIPSDVARKTDFRRKALYPAEFGNTIWEFPTVRIMHRSNGLWETVVILKLGDRASRSTRKQFYIPIMGPISIELPAKIE